MAREGLHLGIAFKNYPLGRLGKPLCEYTDKQKEIPRTFHLIVRHTLSSFASDC